MLESKEKKEIWSTLGPASLNEKVIKRLEEVGVTVFRINLSHTDVDKIEKDIATIKQYTAVPICLDTEGPQVRTGYMENGEVFLKENTIVSINKNHVIGDKNDITLRPESAFDQFRVGDLISVDFDSALLSVIRIGAAKIEARVICSGFVGSNKAVTVDRKIEMNILTEKDKRGIEILKKQQLKVLSLSFVNSKCVGLPWGQFVIPIKKYSSTISVISNKLSLSPFLIASLQDASISILSIRFSSSILPLLSKKSLIISTTVS